jgi:hypothetical protein
MMSSSAVSLLNEYCQQRQLPTPEYNTLTTDGPSHMPVFTMKVVVDEREFVATGASKKAAKCKCAAKAVQELDVDKYFKDRMKVYKYRICDIVTDGALEAVWNEDVEEVALVIKRSNELEEHELKTIKLRVLK